MNKILLINKDKGMTSHDVLYHLKKILKVNKIGHAGTLDPLATGLLVVMINEATKLSNYIMEDIKEYHAEITVGISTDTEDSQGKIIDSKIVSEIVNVDSILESLIGPINQTPPMYSAIKINGKKLYEIARSGKTINRDARMVEIYDLKRTSEIEYFDGKAKFSFSTVVSKGTYVRTLCVEIAQLLGYPAHMSNLCRTKSGSLNLENASTIEDVKKGKYQFIDMLDALSKYKTIEVNDILKKKILNGVKVEADEIESINDVVVFSSNNQLLAIYEKENGKYRAQRVWN